MYEDSLYSDHLQFGFIKNGGCSHDLFGFTEAVKYYINEVAKFTVCF